MKQVMPLVCALLLGRTGTRWGEIARYRSQAPLLVHGCVPTCARPSLDGPIVQSVTMKISSLGNLALHNLQIAFQHFETWAVRSPYYLCTRDPWMAASMQEASQIYQRAVHAFLHAEQHASHCCIRLTSDEFLREHWSAARSLLEAARQAVLHMSNKGKRPCSPSPRRARRCMAMLESPGNI